jgi:hypothetical protein
MRARQDWSEYEGVLAYATELYGISQPLLGWKSGLARRRLELGMPASRDVLWGTMLGRFQAQVANLRGLVREYRLEPGSLAPSALGYGDTGIASIVAREITARAVQWSAP